MCIYSNDFLLVLLFCNKVRLLDVLCFAFGILSLNDRVISTSTLVKLECYMFRTAHSFCIHTPTTISKRCLLTLFSWFTYLYFNS